MFYTVENENVDIIRFLYGRRDWINLLKNMKWDIEDT
jgi:plasmid stabilization system protein ParE